MAEVAEHDDGKKKKGAQKKMTIRVDFTPMVDMNMLLITFFMLCTTMIKSQTLQIVLPSNDNLQKEQLNQAKSSEAYTLILDTEWNEYGMPIVDPETGRTKHSIYWYHGMADTTEYKGDDITGSYLKKEVFLGNNTNGPQGIRKILRASNDKVMEEYEKNKQRYRQKEITKEQFDSISKLNRMGKSEIIDSTVPRPVVIIKPGPNTTYEALINAIDEMNINQISRYSIQLPNHTDTMLLQRYEKDNNERIIRPSVRPGR